MVDIQYFYAKIASNEAVDEDDLISLLKELAHFRKAAGYLSSCAAATLEGLPKSTSKSQRQRHLSICETASKLLVGDNSGMRYQVDLEATKSRCDLAVQNSYEVIPGSQANPSNKDSK